jgi:hypothetical protein
MFRLPAKPLTQRRSFVDCMTPAGTELWLQLRTRVDTDAWAPFSEDQRYYKVQPHFLAAEVDLADLDAISHTENGRTLLPIAPANVLVNGDASSPFWETGSDITLTWWNTSRARTVFGLPFEEAPATDLTHMLFEFRTYGGGDLLATVTEDAADESATVTNAFLAANVNDHFRLRAYGVRNGRRSLDYTDVLVRKV